MKLVVLLLLLAPFYCKSQFIRESVTDNNLVNQYGAELSYYAKKYHIPNAYGFSKSVVQRDGELQETVILFYRDKNGEVEDRIVSARIISYKEVIDSNKKDTVVNIKEQIPTDSLVFNTKSITKSNGGYIVVGNVKDHGLDVPIVLSTFKKDTVATKKIEKESPPELKFEDYTYSLFNGNNLIGKIHKQLGGDIWYLIELNTGQKYIVTSDFWNYKRYSMPWEKQLKYMEDNFKKQ